MLLQNIFHRCESGTPETTCDNHESARLQVQKAAKTVTLTRSGVDEDSWSCAVCQDVAGLTVPRHDVQLGLGPGDSVSAHGDADTTPAQIAEEPFPFETQS